MLANVSPVSPKSCFFPRLQHPSEDPSLVRIPFHLFFFFPSSVSRSSSRLRLDDDMAADSGNRPPFPTHRYTNPSNQSRYLYEPLLRVMSARVLACIRSAGILEEKWGHEYVMSGPVFPLSFSVPKMSFCPMHVIWTSNHVSSHCAPLARKTHG